VKYAWIDGQRKAYPLPTMCTTLAVSISGYRAWKSGGRSNGKRLRDPQLLALIRAIHAQLKGAYGSPRMVKEIRGRGFPAGKERVERLMRENGIRARHKRRYKATTDSKHALPVAPNLLERNFSPSAPNQAWSADLTYVWTDEGWLYLAVVLDLFNREVVGWSIKPRMTSDIVIDALTMAWFRRKPAPGLMHHSDRGALAALCGVSPLEASSGKTTRHRLNRGGDRAANNALWTISMVRMRSDPRTRAYVARRTAEGLSTKEIQRCLKRYIVRELYPLILADLADAAGPNLT
jgi:transposase InsO family protein